MYRYTFHLIVLLLSIPTQPTLARASHSYVDYHSEIRKAEEFILDSNYSSAIERYNETFSKYEFIFLQHAVTATQVAMEAKDTSAAEVFCYRAIKQGLKFEMIYSDPILSQLTLTKNWSNIEEGYDSLRLIYLSKIDTSLRKKINSLYRLDRKYRDKHETHPWNFIWRPFIWMKWKKVTKHIVENELKPIIESKGYPGEKLIGVDEKHMFHNKSKDSYGSFFVTTILMHYYSVPRPEDLNEPMLKEIELGNLLPEHFATFMDYQAEFGKSKYYNGSYYNQWHKNSDPEAVEEINAVRSAIGLEDLETLKKKEKRGINHCKKKNTAIIKLWYFCG
ncbi:MAG: hypothetical protein MK105_13570 [Crocinitomicaceae bacterium]|nr:hypothetical protein [Crocinitomicaceae bacterium]